MSAPTYKVSGVATVTGALDKLARDAADATRPAGEVAALGLAAARAAAPGRTGQLVAGISTRVDAAGAELESVVIYGPYQEFGTRYVQAQRFMRAGADAMESAAPDAFERQLATVVASAQKG